MEVKKIAEPSTPQNHNDDSRCRKPKQTEKGPKGTSCSMMPHAKEEGLALKLSLTVGRGMQINHSEALFPYLRLGPACLGIRQTTLMQAWPPSTLSQFSPISRRHLSRQP